MRIPALLALAGLLAATFGLGSCSKDDDTGTGKGHMEVRLTDAPGPYEQVNVDVQGVEIHVSDENTEDGWQTLTLLQPGVINLLDLANGRDVLLASADFPAGKISQLRLKLGPNNSIKLLGDPTIYQLQTPSAQQSGLKLKIDATLVEDVTYQVLLDFDATKSIVVKGNSANRFSLKPVIRTITTAVAGGVRGKVDPVGEFTSGALLITAAHDTLGTSIAPATGEFIFRGVPAGSYTLALPGANGHAGQTAQQTVTVTNDRITDVGTVRW